MVVRQRSGLHRITLLFDLSYHSRYGCNLFLFRSCVVGIVQDLNLVANGILYQILHPLGKGAGIADGRALLDTGGKRNGVRPLLTREFARSTTSFRDSLRS